MAVAFNRTEFETDEDEYTDEILSDIQQEKYNSIKEDTNLSYYEYLEKYTNKLESVFTEAAVKDSLNFSPEKKRKSKKITNKEEIDKILSINHSQARLKHILMELFGDFGNGPQYNPYDIIEVPKGAFGGLSYSKNEMDKAEAIAIILDYKDPKKKIEIKTSTKKNKHSFTTTVGTLIFNRIFTEPISDILGYINQAITKGGYGKLINSKISYAILEDRMSITQLKHLIENSQLIMSCCSAWSSSHTNTIFTMQEEITKKKEEILNRPGMREKIEAADLTTMKEMEKELIKYSTEKILKDDPSLDMFLSGARSNLDDNFKNMYIMRSGVSGTDMKTTIVTDSYMDGMDLKNYSVIADAAVVGAYSKSCMTAGPGHLERQFLGATSHLSLMEDPDSDCHTHNYKEVKITKDNLSNNYYSYIIEGNKLVELLPSNGDKYIGKTVKMRMSDECEAPNGFICDHCMGTLPRRLKMTNIGLMTPIGMSSLKNGWN